MLIRGVVWDATGPSLSCTTDDGDAAVPLSAGQWLRFGVHKGPRQCVGSFVVLGPTVSVHRRCLESAAAERGHQCGRCFARDDFRYMHDFHRSGIAPAGLRAYLGQPHWLYIATFADGATKVGTASQRSKWSRLAEQGAVLAQYVALADDGRIVRRLEDTVTAKLGLTQHIRSAAKAAALLEPLPAAELAAVNGRHAGAVREILRGVGMAGFQTVREGWDRPALAAGLADPGAAPRERRHAYPSTLDDGGHGLLIRAMLGGYVLAGMDGIDPDFVANLGQLKGRRITLGHHRSAVPIVQDSLF
ncbi:MAG: DUF2797 domain-containing protein [Actinomycetota bacterium]|nr:DUF2797 domain-containing protein [Actinomycetota bacterium]